MASGCGFSGFVFSLIYVHVVGRNLYWFFLLSCLLPLGCTLAAFPLVGRT